MDDELKNYRLQLEQVIAALTTDPENDELLKLRSDLEEVIELTQDLIRTQQEEASKAVEDGRCPAELSASDEDDVTASLLAAERSGHGLPAKRRKWKAGDKCIAKWEDGQYYDALIEEVKDATARVTFPEYNQTETLDLDDIKEVTVGVKRPAEDSGDEGGKGKPHNREYLKKKKQKKQQRFKQIEEDRESEKNKWLSFSAKSSKKSGSKGKSIFASPDNVNGRVGIGTCGVSGKPMTEFTHGEKWRKGT